MIKMNLKNKKFNNLKVIKYAGLDKYKNSLWICKCLCGNYTTVRGTDLKRESVKSCGCLIKVPIYKIHGLSNNKLYKLWISMKQRCINSKTKFYKNYGGRGIKVCNEWKENFKSFYNWAISNGYKEGLTLDRINVDGNYEPNNCRWINRHKQSFNRRGVKNSTSKYKGVCWDKSKKKWIASITFNKKRIYLGSYSSEKIAAKAYNEKAKQLFGKYSHLNKVS